MMKPIFKIGVLTVSGSVTASQVHNTALCFEKVDWLWEGRLILWLRRS